MPDFKPRDRIRVIKNYGLLHHTGHVITKTQGAKYIIDISPRGHRRNLHVVKPDDEHYTPEKP
jgi:hypothetical protein